MSQYAQTFGKYKIQYKYDEKSDTLIEIGKIDMQELYNSNRDCALDVILSKFSHDEINKFLNQNIIFDDDKDKIIESAGLSDPLQMYDDASSHVFEVAAKYGLSGDDALEISREILRRKDDLAKYLNDKEVELNGKSKKIKPQGESSELSTSEKDPQEKSN